MNAAVGVILSALVLVALAMAAMAIGVMMRRPCLRGSCGGTALRDHRGREVSCATCPNRKLKQEQQPQPQERQPH